MSKTGKIDFKKKFKDLYKVKEVPTLVDVPPFTRISISGIGNPNGEKFNMAIMALYKLSYTIMFAPKKGVDIAGYYSYVLPPLEGIYTTSNNKPFSGDKDKLKWVIFINQPEFVTKDVFKQIKSKLKLTPTMKEVKLEKFIEKKSIQILHIGPFATEIESITKMIKFLEPLNKEIIPSSHHEIYLSDFRKVASEKLKTIVRYQIRNKK